MSDSSNILRQRRGGKSIEMQKKLVISAKVSPGYTVDQLSWMNAGFEVDKNGVCQPSGLHSKVQSYFGFKRRGAEIAFHPFKTEKNLATGENVRVPLSDSEIKAAHPNAKLVYCKASNNPYSESGGAGVRLLGSQSSSHVGSVGSQPAAANAESNDCLNESNNAFSKDDKGMETETPQSPVNVASKISDLQDMLGD